MTAKTDKGQLIEMGKKEYWEIGIDMDGEHRLGAWQIKEIIDLTLPPMKTTKERFITELLPDTKSAEIEVRLTYYPAPKKEIQVHRFTKTITFE